MLVCRYGQRRTVISSCVAFISCMLFVTFFGPFALKVLAEPLPRLEFAAPVYDFGSVAQGKTIVHGFSFVNEGEAELVIQRVVPACGCTIASLSHDRYQPGEKGRIDVTFDSSGFWGNKVKSVRVYSNDPRRPSYVLTVQGVVVREVEVNPSRIYFGSVRGGTENEKSFSVSTSSSELKILEVESKSEYLKVKMPIVADDNGIYHGTVALSNKVPVGMFRHRIVVKTTSNEYPVLTIPVFARIEGDLVAEPQDISFGLVNISQEPTGGFQAEARVINRSPEPVHVLSAESSSINLSVSVVPLQKGKEYLIKILVNPDFRGSLKEQVVVKTDHQESSQKEVIIPVYGIVAESESGESR
ncbi:MAG: DUF1573 domain-containing protein [bacterium]|nr:DUF1573 domain-containing protein [bacterium]